MPILQFYVAMQVMQPGDQCKLAQFATNTSGASWWPNSQPIQMVPPNLQLMQVVPCGCQSKSRSKFLGPLCLWQCLDQGFTLHTSVFYLFWHEIHFAIHRTAVDKWNSPCTINSLKVLKCFPFSNKTRLPNEWELPKLWALKIFIMFNVDI